MYSGLPVEAQTFVFCCRPRPVLELHCSSLCSELRACPRPHFEGLEIMIAIVIIIMKKTSCYETTCTDQKKMEKNKNNNEE